jgi:aspartate/methionine/tyrosine aminotransferase
LDYAFCRWLAIEKGIALMPLSCFCLEESPYKLEKYVRLAICKTPEFFKDKDLLSRFAAL